MSRARSLSAYRVGARVELPSGARGTVVQLGAWWLPNGAAVPSASVLVAGRVELLAWADLVAL